MQYVDITLSLIALLAHKVKARAAHWFMIHLHFIIQWIFLADIFPTVPYE